MDSAEDMRPFTIIFYNKRECDTFFRFLVKHGYKPTMVHEGNAYFLHVLHY